MPNRRISGGDIINEISVEGDVEIPTRLEISKVGSSTDTAKISVSAW